MAESILQYPKGSTGLFPDSQIARREIYLGPSTVNSCNTPCPVSTATAGTRSPSRPGSPADAARMWWWSPITRARS